MKPETRILATLALLNVWLSAGSPAAAQEEFVLRVYPVADLLVSAPDHPYRSEDLPTVGLGEEEPPVFAGMGGGMGGMGGGMGGMIVGAQPKKGAGGESRGTEPEASKWGSPDRDMDGLIELIHKIVDPPSWEDQGGQGTCAPFGTVLAVRQTVVNHEKITEFLDAVRSEGDAAKTVLVRACWLMLDSDQLDGLVPAGAAGSARGLSAVDTSALETMIREVPSFRGQITCFSGQQVHLVAGSRRAVVIGAIPVVGSAPAYQPLMANPNIGVLFEVTPSLLPGGETAVLDLRSTVTGSRQPGPPVRIGGPYPAETKTTPGMPVEHTPAGVASITVDRVHMPTQQLATTVRVPLGKPVLVGGLTLDPTDGETGDSPDGERKQLYLVVEANAGGEE